MADSVEGRSVRAVSSSFSASAILRSTRAWKNFSLSMAGGGGGCGAGFSTATFDFVFFGDIFDAFFSHFEYAFPFR